MNTPQNIYKALWCLLFVFCSCSSPLLYHTFHAVPESGWQRGQREVFPVGRIPRTDDYTTTLLVRLDNSYKYLDGQFIIERTVYPSREHRRDTVVCNLVSNDGRTLGTGLNYHVTEVPLSRDHLLQGDSLVITLFHNMHGAPLRGITAVGLRVE